jgi:hypothetical protein
MHARTRRMRTSGMRGKAAGRVALGKAGGNKRKNLDAVATAGHGQTDVKHSTGARVPLRYQLSVPLVREGV